MLKLFTSGDALIDSCYDHSENSAFSFFTYNAQINVLTDVNSILSESRKI